MSLCISDSRGRAGNTHLTTTTTSTTHPQTTPNLHHRRCLVLHLFSLFKRTILGVFTCRKALAAGRPRTPSDLVRRSLGSLIRRLHLHNIPIYQRSLSCLSKVRVKSYEVFHSESREPSVEEAGHRITLYDKIVRPLLLGF